MTPNTPGQKTPKTQDSHIPYHTVPNKALSPLTLEDLLQTNCHPQAPIPPSLRRLEVEVALADELLPKAQGGLGKDLPRTAQTARSGCDSGRKESKRRQKEQVAKADFSTHRSTFVLDCCSVGKLLEDEEQPMRSHAGAIRSLHEWSLPIGPSRSLCSPPFLGMAQVMWLRG